MPAATLLVRARELQIVGAAGARDALSYARRWVTTRVLDPVLLLLRRGADPRQLALSVAVGFYLGLFPVIGVTTFICAGMAAVIRDRFNVPTMVIANLLAAPLELSLVIPYLRLGEGITRSPRLSVRPSELWGELTAGPSGAVRSVANAILGWAVTGPVIVWVLYITMVPVLHEAKRRFGSAQSSGARGGDIEAGGDAGGGTGGAKAGMGQGSASSEHLKS